MKIRAAVYALLLCISLGMPALAVDKAAIIEHVRQSIALPSGVELSLGDPKPSEVPGFDVMELTLSRGPNKQVDKLYLSKDGRYYVLGGFNDLQHSPDKTRLSKIDFTTAPTRGNKNAPVSIVEYTDFQCPYCEIGYQVMRDKIMKEYGSQVKWVYKSFPLKNIHPWAEPAAIGAECAHRQGESKFWTMHDALFDNQKSITYRNVDDKIAEFAKAQGLDTKKFEACYKGRETLAVVDKDLAEAQVLEVPGTPAFFVDGRLIASADYDALKEIIDQSLKKKHGSS